MSFCHVTIHLATVRLAQRTSASAFGQLLSHGKASGQRAAQL